ncbi:MAG TPA: substrate-binding domain-containing protein [Candidatus Brocadiia bacterium]|nr:substrate-binding domain-containing protein [Candidatus Brocadiia bacterium]
MKVFEQSTASAQFAETLRRDIAEGQYLPQEPFPSLKQLSERFGVGMRVARNAMRLLEEQGLIYRVERRGAFVRGAAKSRHEAPLRREIECVTIVERAEGTMPGFNRAAYLQGYTDALDPTGIRLRFVSCPADPRAFASIFAERYPLEHQACLLLNVLDAGLLGWLASQQVVFVVQNFVAYDAGALPPHHGVMVNKVGAGFIGAQRLLAAGHRRIAFVGRTPGKHSNVAAYYGYEAALRLASVELHADLLSPLSTDDPAVAQAGAREMLSRPNRPTAVLADTDAIGFGFLEAARELGLSVPRDLSVVGINGLPQGARTSPPLTSVALPARELGRAAMELVLEAAQGRVQGFQRRVLESHLIERQSVAPPACAG